MKDVMLGLAPFLSVPWSAIGSRVWEIDLGEGRRVPVMDRVVINCKEL